MSCETINFTLNGLATGNKFEFKCYDDEVWAFYHIKGNNQYDMQVVTCGTGKYSTFGS